MRAFVRLREMLASHKGLLSYAALLDRAVAVFAFEIVHDWPHIYRKLLIVPI